MTLAVLRAVHGADVESSWNGGTGSWEVPGNWTHAGGGSSDFPNNDALTYDATISTGTAQLDTTDITINRLTIDGGTLATTEPGVGFIELVEGLDFSSGEIDDATVVIQSQPDAEFSNWTGGTVQNGALLENSDLLFLGGTDLFITGTGGEGSTLVRNLGEMQWDSESPRTIHFSSGGRFTLEGSSAQLLISGSGDALFANDGPPSPLSETFVNDGLLRKEGVGNVEFDVLYGSEPDSVLDLIQGAVIFNFGGGPGISAAEQEGTINIGNGGEYIVNGAEFVYEETATINNSGTLEVRAGRAEFFLGFGQHHQIYNGDGTDHILVSGGVLRATVPTTVFHLELTDGEIQDSPLDVTQFEWSGGTLVASSVNAEGVVTLSGSLVMLGSTVTSNVIGSWNPADLDELFLDNSTVATNGPFTIDVPAPNETAAISGIDSRFDNRGDFVKSGSGRLDIGVAMRNEELATIDVRFGTLALGNPDTSLHGTVMVDGPATLEMSAGTLQGDGVITGDGDLMIGGSPKVQVNGQIDESLSVNIVGEVQLNRGQSVGSWFLSSSSTISGPGNLHVPPGNNLQMTGGIIGGTGTLQVDGDFLLTNEEGFPGDHTLNRQIVVNGELQILNSAVTLGAGASIVVTGVLRLTGSEDVTFQDSEAQIINAGETFIGVATATTTFGVNFVNRGELRITNSDFSSPTGSVVFQKAFRQESGRTLYSAGTVSMDLIDLVGGTLNSLSDPLGGATSHTIAAPLLGGPTSAISLEDVTIEALPGFPVVIPGADLTIGDAARFDGFRTEGTIRTVDRVLTIHSAGFASLGVLTELDGGSLIAANGVALGIGDNISGHGTVDARVAATLGSTIAASGGDLEIGNAAAFDGITSEGTLRTNGNTMTLHDANEAVLGSLTTLGTVSADGTLVAANGLVIEFGKNVTGRGLIDTQDDPAKPVINNGLVQGDSLANPIVMDGYVKGVGTFNNVTFTGTHAPGLSPTALSVGNVSYSGDTATLAIELGGLIAGTQFDQINSSAMIALDGNLAVQLVNGFLPDEGDLFEILTATGGISGTFDTLPGELPALSAGLQWQINYGTNDVTLAVVAAALLGDYNNNGEVDAADYSVWRDALTAGATSLTNDSTPGVVDESDFIYWRDHFGQTLGSGSGAGSAAVPEPGSAALWVLAAVGAALAYRRRINCEKSSRSAYRSASALMWARSLVSWNVP